MSRARALSEGAVVLMWATGVAALTLYVVYPIVPSGWPSVAAQSAAYLVTVAPVFVLRWPRLPFGGSRTSVVLSALVLVAAAVFAALMYPASPVSHLRRAIDAVTPGIAEEVTFRGLLRDRIAVLVPQRMIQVPVVALLFTLYHVPSVLRSGDGFSLITVFVLGLVFGALRELSRGMLLPAAVHIAVDLSS